MEKSIKELKECFLNFNHFINNCNKNDVNEEELLLKVYNILIKEPKANHFWYTYPEHGEVILIYSLPSDDCVPGNSLLVNKEKIKMFLRDKTIKKLCG